MSQATVSQFIAVRAERLDQAIARQEAVSVSAARRLLATEQVRVNGKKAAKGLQLRVGDTVTLLAFAESAERLKPLAEPALPLRVLYEDAWVVAVEKPAGWATHPLRAGETGTLANALVAKFPECLEASADPREAGLAHRLDQGTSGVLLAARDRETFDRLRDLFAAHQVEKRYVALVEGEFGASRVISHAIVHDTSDRRRVCTVPMGTEGALEAVTEVSLLSSRAGFSWVEARSRFGRMHQIRAHLAAEGFPLVGDRLYGGVHECPMPRAFVLHAAQLTLPHPRQTNETLTLVCAFDMLWHAE